MTIMPRITCANLRKSSRPSASVTAIGVKGQRNNNNRGGGRRPGFEAMFVCLCVRACVRACVLACVRAILWQAVPFKTTSWLMTTRD